MSQLLVAGRWLWDSEMSGVVDPGLLYRAGLLRLGSLAVVPRGHLIILGSSTRRLLRMAQSIPWLKIRS